MPETMLRPVDRPLQLSRAMGRMFDRPLAMTEADALRCLAVVRGKYGLNLITSGGEVMDDAAMNGMIAEARQQAAVDATRRRGQIFDEADDVAVIPVWGTLMQSWGLDPWCGITGYDGIEAKVIAASLDDNIKAIWLDVDSGGGDVSGLFDLCDLIWSVNAKNGGKPIFAFVNEHAYSAAYAIASCADKVWMPRYGGVGSVGVITIHQTFARQDKAQGIDVTVIRAGEQKARANSVELLPPETKDHIQKQIDVIRTGFINLVTRNMPGVTAKTVRETEALDYMGEDARAIGFVTGICSYVEAWGKLQTRINR